MHNTLAIHHLPADILVPYASNPRTHSKAQIEQIARSIREFGFINPIIIDNDHRIVAGHGRLLAAMKLGLALIPCLRIDHLSEDQKRAYLLADNKLAENAGWDPDLLRIEIKYLADPNVAVDVSLTGFSIPEIDLLLLDEAADEPPLPVLPSPAAVISKPGDLWQCGPHRILCGDTRDSALVAQLLGKQRAHMVLSDPPYNVRIDGHAGGAGRIKHAEFAMASGEMSDEEFLAFLSRSLRNLAKLSKDGALHYIFMDWRHLKTLLAAAESIYTDMLNLCVWRKTNGGMGSLYRSQHELIGIFKYGKASHRNNVELGKHGRYRTNVWDFAGVNSFGANRDDLALHPTVKPVKMLAEAMLDVTARGEIVLDGFLGAGSTLLAADQTGRVCYGIEIDPRYVDVTLHRWIALTGEVPVELGSGRRFEPPPEDDDLPATTPEEVPA